MKTGSWIVGGLALALLAAAPAEAQRFGPDHALRLRLGMYTPEGEGEYFADKQIDFTGEAEDLEDLVGGVDYIFHSGRRIGLMLSADRFEGEMDQEYIEFVDEFGAPIRHTTTLEVTPLTAGLVVHLAPESFPVNPYVGAGGGAYLWRLEEAGDFIDFGVNPPEIFTDAFEAEGSVLGYYLLAGLEVPLGPYFSAFAEGRWDNADDDLEDDFAGFGTLDLSGRRVMGGVAWRF